VYSAAGIGLVTAIKYLRRTASGAAGNGLFTAIKYLHCHGGLYADNIENNMVSHWEMARFQSVCSPYYS
jgi:hypothetical protein